MLVDIGQQVPEGVGPKKSIVAYSTLCQHMGCPVVYQPALREFVCPCHQSRYDPERLGSIIQGVAMLPSLGSCSRSRAARSTRSGWTA